MTRTSTTRSAVVPVLAEAFRENGYEGASMAVLTDASGLGKGSLYNFFPGGKQEMASAVLDDIDTWFRERVFAPLRAAAGAGPAEAAAAIGTMYETVTEYFQSGRRICLPGAFALGSERERFAEPVGDYFAEWIGALADALRTAGASDPQGAAVRAVASIQGAIVLSRALDDPAIFQNIVASASLT